MDVTILKRIFRSFACLSVLALIGSGCGGGAKLPDGMPAPQPTSITITQDGSPLPGASVALIPVDSSNQWNAGATTDDKGVAVVHTLGQYAGAVPGKYKVIITKRESEKSGLTAPDPNTDPQGYAKYMEESKKVKLATYDLIDPKYSKGTTPEEVEIVQGNNEKTIDVGAAVRVKK